MPPGERRFILRDIDGMPESGKQALESVKDQGASTYLSPHAVIGIWCIDRGNTC